MTDLLTRVSARRPASPDASDGVRRPLALAAALAGAASPAVALLLLWAVGLVGWFAADGGSHGTTRSVLRIAADTWLLGHGANLTLTDAVVTASPLGLMLACAYLTYRFGHWAGSTSAVDDLRSVGAATVVLSGVYAVIALLTSVLAAAPGASPSLGLAFVGGAVVGAAGGGLGLLRGTGRLSELRRSLPVQALSVLYGAVAVVVLMLVAGALLTAVALAVNGAAAANVVEELNVDATGGVLSLLLLVAIAPNVALLADGYLLGSGFAVGAGTVVSPQEVVLGPVPSVPVLAALPPDGWAPGWAMVFLVVPVAVAAGASYLAGRVLPTGSYQTGATRGLGAGVLGGVLLAIAMSWAGGSIGPGRMAENGVAFWATLLAAMLALGPGGALGGVLGTWWTRRHDLPDAEHEARPPRVPAAKPLEADGEEVTEPIHLPKVEAEPLVPSPRGGASEPDDLATDFSTDFSTEDTVQVRLPGRPPAAED